MPALEVNVTLPPVQNVVEPIAEMVGVADKAFTVTVTGSEEMLWQGVALETCTV